MPVPVKSEARAHSYPEKIKDGHSLNKLPANSRARVPVPADSSTHVARAHGNSGLIIGSDIDHEFYRFY